MAERHAHSQPIQTYGPAPHNRNIWPHNSQAPPSRLADSFVLLAVVYPLLTTNSTLADLSRSQTDISARLERLQRASPDLNPVELRTNSSDGNFVFHAVPPQVTAPLVTRPSIT